MRTTLALCALLALVATGCPSIELDDDDTATDDDDVAADDDDTTDDPEAMVLVTEKAGTTVAVLDPGSDQLVQRLEVGPVPTSMTVDQERGLVYVAVHEDGRIAAIDRETLEVVDVDVPGLGIRPISVDLLPGGERLLVTTRGDDPVDGADDRVELIDLDTSTWPPTGVVAATVLTGEHPIRACVGRDGEHAVVTVRNEPAILVIEVDTMQVVAEAVGLPPDAEPEGCDTHPGANVVYVTLHGLASTVEIVDLDALTFAATVQIEHQPPAQPSTGVFTPDGGRFFVSGQPIAAVLMFDSADPLLPIQDLDVALPVGPQPHFITWLPDGRGYVANTNIGQPTGSISVIHDYVGDPTVSDPILEELEGPLAFASLLD